MKISDISSETGLSPSLIRQMIKTYNAFPDESTRIHSLSFYHHRLAAVRTDDPHKWIALAADNEWSSRQMAEEIKKAKCGTEESERELAKSRAEKVLRQIDEILAREDEVSEWLYDELSKIVLGNSAKAS